MICNRHGEHGLLDANVIKNQLKYIFQPLGSINEVFLEIEMNFRYKVTFWVINPLK